MKLQNQQYPVFFSSALSLFMRLLKTSSHHYGSIENEDDTGKDRNRLFVSH